MIGLDYLMAGHLLLADYKVRCAMKAAPEITVSASGLDTVIDNSRTIQQLNAFKPMIGTKSPYGQNSQTHIEGLMHGGIGVGGDYMFSNETYPALNKVCMYVAKVNVKISIDPKIFIAKEYAPGTCHYNAVLEHEQKHVAVDKRLVNKYTNIIVKAVNNTLKQVGYSHGPYDASQLPALQKQISAIIESVIKQFSENMNKERQVLQQEVDTLKEYGRVDALCPDKPQIKL